MAPLQQKRHQERHDADTDSGIPIVFKRMHESGTYVLLVGIFLECFESAHTNAGIAIVDECADQCLFDRFIRRFLRQSLNCFQP